MRDIDQPDKISVAWGRDAAPPYIRPVPLIAQPQSGGTKGFASWPTGFPPPNFAPVASGGVPPFGADANGALNQISAGLQWTQAIGINFWDSDFSTAVGGYPSGSVVQSVATFGLFYQSTVDNNTSNPDEGGLGWTAFSIYGRIRLSSNLNLYVATTGDDNNPGTVDFPFATMQRALTVLYALYDLNGFRVTVHVAGGTYDAGAIMSGSLLGQSGIPIRYFADAPVTINTSGWAFEATSGAVLQIDSNNFTVNVVANGEGLGYGAAAELGGEIFITGIINFSYCASAHLLALTGGQIYQNAGQEDISGPTPVHYLAADSGLILANNVGWNLILTPFFETAFAYAQNNGVIVSQNGSQGGTTAVGPRFLLQSGGQIATAGSSPTSYFPGNADGSGLLFAAPTSGGSPTSCINYS